MRLAGLERGLDFLEDEHDYCEGFEFHRHGGFVDLNGGAWLG